MTTRRKTRIAVGLLVAVSLIVTACGSRLEHNTIAAAALGTQTQSGSGATLPGSSGATSGGPIGDSDLPESPAGPVGDSGLPGASGSPSDAASQAGSAGGTAAGDPARAGRNSGSGRAQGKPIVIGTVGTYSGVVGSIHAQGARALQAWAAEINAAGGINGRPIQVIVKDDGGDAGRSRSHVQELVETNQVVAIVAAHVLTHAKNAWIDYVEKKKVPVVGGACGLGWNSSPMLFNQCVDNTSFAYGTVLVGGKYGKGNKFGALICTEEESCPIWADRWFNQGDAKRAGLDPRYRASISITQPDFTSECIAARNAGVELFAVLADARTIERVAASCRRQNFTPQILAISLSVDATMPTKPGLADVIVASATFPFAGSSTPAFREFEATWRKYGREPAKGAASLGWASAQVFEKVVKRAGKDVSREGLLKQLYSIKNDNFGGLTVPLTFGPKGTALSNCTFVMQGRSGKWSTPTDKPICW